MQGAQRNRFPHSQAVEFVDQVDAVEIVDLVGDQDRRRLAAADDLRQVLVARADAGEAIDDQQHQGGLLQGRLDLGAYLARHLAAVGGIDAAGVDRA